MSEKETFEQVMNKIAMGLTGDAKNDAVYLLLEGKKYKDHSLAKEIGRGVGRMITEILPPVELDKIVQLTKNQLMSLDNVLEEAEFQIHKKNFDRALELLEGMVKRTEGMFESDSQSVYFRFDNYLEDVLCRNLFDTKKNIHRLPRKLPKLYAVYGSLLFELKRYDEAKDALIQGLIFNPVSVWPMFELGEIFKLEKNFDQYLRTTARALSCAYESGAIARAYRNYAYYYGEQEKYDIAVALLITSNHYDNSTAAQSELFYIMQKSDGKLQLPDSDEINRILKQEDIQIGPSKMVMDILVRIVRDALQDKDRDNARYYLAIAYDLTGDEKLLALAESLGPDDADNEYDVKE